MKKYFIYLLCFLISSLSVSAQMNNATIIVLTSINPTIGSRAFVAGDAVGLFYTLDGELICGGYSIWDNANMGITVWGDDPQTTIKDGFYVGEPFTFRIWDSQAQIDYLGNATAASGPMTYQINGITTLASLSAVIPPVVQTLNLSSGWNMVSSFVIPAVPLIENMFAPIASNINIMKNNSGQFWIPGVVNSITNWDYKEGYQINMKINTSIDISGTKVIPWNSPISLAAGWNFIAYLRDNPKDITLALASIPQSYISVVKNNAGQFWVPGVVNTIGNMLPGHGYQIYLLSGCVLTYPEY